MTILDIGPNWGPRTATKWSLISLLQRQRDSIEHTVPAHIVLIQLSAINERSTAVASDRPKFYRPTRGAIEIIPSDTDHKATWEHPKSSALFALKADALEAMAEREIGSASIHVAGPPLGTTDKYVLQLAELMRLHFADGGLLAEMHAEAISTLLAIHILQNYSSCSVRRSQRARGGLRPASRRAILEFMEARIAVGMTIMELAEIAGLSVSQFMRAFKSEFGLSPHRYLLDRRIQVAAEAIRSTVLPLSQIALDGGFSSQSHMNAAFARFGNITPGEIRRNLR